MTETSEGPDQLSLILSGIIKNKIDDSNIKETILVQLQDMMEFVQGIVEQIEISGESPAVSCSSGCSYCCHSQVNITPVESLLIHAFVLKHFTESEAVDLKKRILHTLFLTQGKTLKERFEIKEQAPCVFLKEDQCCIYSARPFICRSWNSLDQKACISAFHSTNYNMNIDASPMRNYVFQTARDQFEALNRELKLETGLLDIPLAIHKCLCMSDPLSYWLAGEFLFDNPDTNYIGPH